MKIVYEGDLSTGFIKDGDVEYRFVRFKEMEIPDALGKKLIAQGLWKIVKKNKGGKNERRIRR